MRFFAGVFFAVAFAFAAKTVTEPAKFTVDSLVILSDTFSIPSAIWYKEKLMQPQVFVWFHGGMQSAKCTKGYEAGNALVPFLEKSKKEVAVVSVSACKNNHWLTQSALLAVDNMLDSVQERFKIKIDTVSLIGVSDGGLGVVGYTLYGKRTIKSRMLVSTNLSSVADAANLATDPKVKQGSWKFLQGGSDRLYPSNEIVPWIERFCRALGSKKCIIRFDERGEHDWSWWTANRSLWILNFLP